MRDMGERGDKCALDATLDRDAERSFLSPLPSP